ncbi:major intrinsically disordered Notch2-binding receptor 1 [Tachyglossus aculeatus]|uniref:major intrinsically disordered Notch2-binding receptor 1 n=1 Tax=Tachyglossus aculeatus TaxID=9261 RepID=UPI0018F2B372|nr:major intrinsically disordered Notch2-binding receptor 1 [Tachyglossus aculeatus]
MDPNQESSLFLVKILEELETKQNTISYQDLCKSLCARFDLSQLAKLRSVLFYTACLDPNFPATLFKDKMRCNVNNRQSKKIMVAADIVTIFNLIQMNGGPAKEKLPAAHQKVRKKELFESCRSDTELCNVMDCGPAGCELRDGEFNRGFSSRRSSKCRKLDFEECQQQRQDPEANFPLRGNKEVKRRTGSLDRLQALVSYSISTSQPCEMQRTYFPMTIENESISEQDSLSVNPEPRGSFVDHEEPFAAPSCIQKRNIFKEDFHNLISISPSLISPGRKVEDGGREPRSKKESQKPLSFNHSFELPYSSRYLNAVYSPIPDKRRAKHESLDDLQASTYFGPTTLLGNQETKPWPGKVSKQTAWPVKSWSLNTEEVPDFERSFFSGKPIKEKLLYASPSGQPSNFAASNRHQPYLNPKDHQHPVPPGSYALKHMRTKSKDIPLDLETEEAVKTFKDKGINCPSVQLRTVDQTSSVGTQTDQQVLDQSGQGEDPDPPGQGQFGERCSTKPADEDLEIVSDDISDIFRFLDDMSISGSTGLIQSSCCNSTGSLSQVNKSECDSSPEHNLAKGIAGSSSHKADKLAGMESGHTGDELKASVCKLVLRIGEIEKKLESLSGVREEISQVLGKLNRLDQKIQQPEEVSVQIDLNSLTSEAQSEDGPSLQMFQKHRDSPSSPLENNPDWCCSDASGSNTDSLRVKALKKSLFTRRSSRSLTEENSATESKIASISNSPRDWRTVTYTNQAGLGEGEMKERSACENKDWLRKSKEVDQQYGIPQPHRISKQSKEGFLIEQVFSPQPYPASLKSHLKSNPGYTDMRLTDLAEVKRVQPSWTLEEYTRNSSDKGKLSALDLQTQESLNPNNLEYWMEDIYTPGYDSLLKRKEAEFRRAKVCKIAALISAAICTVILVIVVPICTMKS